MQLLTVGESGKEFCYFEVKVSRSDWQKANDFVRSKGKILKIGGEYYEIVYIQAMFGD